MSDEIISLRVGKELRKKLRMHNHINWSVVIRKALEQDLSIYDSTYLALAQINGAELITEDKKLLKTPNAFSLENA